MNKSAKKAEFGDFQTPSSLAKAVCKLLSGGGIAPASLLEPTCGLGSFLFAGLDTFRHAVTAVGLDIDAGHLRLAQAEREHRNDAQKIRLVEADFFDTDWKHVIAELPEPVLLLGNPPWVTNSHLAALGSRNLPHKSNFQNRNGLDAITGKANFDISEWMLIRLMEAMIGRHGTLAMLCKSAVARKVLCHAWKNSLPMEKSAIYRIDAATHFSASVDAVLLITHFRPSANDHLAAVHPQLNESQTETTIGYEDGVLLSNVAAYRRRRHLTGKERKKWRSGIKHDCSKVMELQREGTKYRNGLGDVVELEDAYLYPMLKSSDVAKKRGASGVRWMIVPQRTVSEDTARIEELAPRTWSI